MDASVLSARPRKKRRRRDDAITEDDIETADAIILDSVIRETEHGPVEESIEIPVWTNRPVPNTTTQDVQPTKTPDVQPLGENHWDADGPQDDGGPGKTRYSGTQQYYLQEFVDRVHPMLEALLSREALPASLTCARCAAGSAAGSAATWRCKDCTTPSLMCRCCMRQSHRDNPLHRVEKWTGKFFRAAELWEVGAYMLIPHHSGEGICPTLQWNQITLERFQTYRDSQEQLQCERQACGLDGVPGLQTDTASMEPNLGEAERPDDDTTYEADVAADAQLGRRLDRMFAKGEMGEAAEDVSEDGDEEEELNNNLVHPPNYMPMVIQPEAKQNNSATGDSWTAGEDGTGMPPRSDALRNPYVRVVHPNGVHHIALVYCTCRGHESAHSDLMAQRLIPTSFTRYRTLFTHAVLDDFRMANLECKASAYQYFQKLCRHTSPMAPDTVPNLYHELRRMSRIWRWLKKLKWAGFAHRDKKTSVPKAGELANFCPACPQVGINIPDNWPLDPQRWVYQRSFVADGNFKADHVRQKKNNDVWLSEGGGMMSLRSEYDDFLSKAKERSTRAPCENHFKAIEAAMMLSKACDVTGIVAIACARHGCFTPNSVANLFRGEQQKNVDWALVKACQTTTVDSRQGLLLIYDIACQYIIHLKERIGDLLPAGLDVDSAVGLFHVHGHKDICFFRYATTFIPGAAVVAGEILESLWAVLNAVTPAMRTATLAHRAEIMDDHMTDSNHKKALGLTTWLCQRYTQAAAMSRSALQYYDRLTIGIDRESVEEWEAVIRLAESKRKQDRSVMDILGAAKPLSEESTALPEMDHAANELVSEWLQLAFQLQEKQIDIQDRVRRLTQDPREDARQEIEKLRESLSMQLERLEGMRHCVTIEVFAVDQVDLSDNAAAFDDLDVGDNAATAREAGNAATAQEAGNAAGLQDTATAVPPESRRISIPSSWESTDNIYRAVELRLRILQADKTLQALRDTIADKSFQYSHVIRPAPRKAVNTRARTAISKLHGLIIFYSRVYGQCRAAMARLGADNSILDKYQILRKDDLKSSTALLNPNEPGSTRVQLSWIWQTFAEGHQSQPEILREFKRVHWLRARAQKQRWMEEFTLVGYEMTWTVNYFLYQASLWENRGIEAEKPGAMAYAARKAAMWRAVAGNSDKQFRVTKNHVIYNTSFYLLSSATLAMASTNPMYTPWDSIPYITDLVKIQAIVTYCASRFRVSAAAFADVEEREEREFFLRHFCSELLFCLSYIGLAAAIGHPVDIPVLIRALACDYYRGGQNMSILNDPHFVLSLDAATAEDDPAAIVDRYAYSWWIVPIAEDVETMAESNIEVCLEYHNLTAKTVPVVPGRFEKLKYTWCRDIGMHPQGLEIECRRCRLYRAVSMKAADEILDLRHQLQGWEEYSKTHSCAVGRESVCFFELEQAAIRKELNGGGPNAGGHDAGRANEGVAEVGGGMLYRDDADSQQSQANMKYNQSTRLESEQVRLQAAAELVRLQSLPNLKWTSGPDLTDDEAIKSLRPAAHRVDLEHSGYASSLPGGFKGDWSSEDSLPFTSGRFSAGPQDDQRMRDLVPHEYPSHFERSPLRHCFGEGLVLVDGRLEEPPAARRENQPASVLHPPPANYVSPPPEPNVNYGTGQTDIASTFHSAGVSGIFSDSSNEDVVMRRPPAARGSDAFSDSSDEQKVCAAGPHEAFSDSDFSDEGGSGQKVGITGDEVFSDSEIEAEIEEVPATTSTGDGCAAAALFPFSDSEIEAENEEVTPAGSRESCSGGAAAASFSFSDSEVFSESENEADNEEITPVVPGRFTATSFTKPIPESWLRDVSDTE